MYIGLHVKYPPFLTDFNGTWIFSTDFRKYSNIKFQENPSSGSRVVPCGQKGGRTDGQTDMTMLAAAFQILRTRLMSPKTLQDIYKPQSYIF